MANIQPGVAPPSEFFRDVIYAQSPTVPWDVKKAQPALERAQDVLSGSVLDVGSGLGDNAIWVASLPAVKKVLGLDIAPVAVAEATQRAQRAGLTTDNIQFALGDVFDPASFGAEPESFDTLLDSAVFHCIGDDDAQRRYLASITPLIKQGGRAVMLVFSDENDAATWRGPRRISAAHARALWEEAGWRVDALETDARYLDTMGRCDGLGGHALLMTATRL